ncbi:BON domain-containing protein [Streptomyces sp. SID13031]|uniref:BON domain-containing protein n=1 Tax=Streptomyces sp. SID13031 TaxID=2706046 RepID=UPI0013CC392C|nr:BON domain-containing protein [Streptomyces sp. SID13031]NEA30595.1 BON domain-containing protein [Streptomyces sp. SID13031]
MSWDDDVVRGLVLQALMLDSLVPATVDARVVDGFVTLSGTVNWQYRRDEADLVASNIAGALDVFNDLEVAPPLPSAADAEDSIRKAFVRNAALDADGLLVSTFEGAVTVRGAVRSWAERNEAVAAAWAAPGVTSVRDELTIKY